MRIIFGVFLILVLSIRVVSAQISFSPHVQIQNAGIISYCVSEDFNNDGLNDLVTASTGAGIPLLWIYEQQNGQLNFQDSIDYNGVGGVQSISSGDLNNDGLKDLVISFRDTLKIYFQDSMVGFFNPSNSIVLRPDSGESVHGIVCGDLNSDGLSDLAVALWNEPSVHVYSQNINHTFTHHTYYKRASIKNELLISDMNQDGQNDLIVSNGGTYNSHDTLPGRNCFAIYLQDTSSHFLQFPLFFAIDTITQNAWIENTASGIGIGDLDNDGHNDIVTSTSARQKAYIWHYVPGHPDLFPNPPDSLDVYINPGPVVIKDLNNDGKNEILICNDGFSLVSLYESNLNFQFTNYSFISIWNSGNMEQGMMSVTDLNDDSLPDLVTTYSYGASIAYNTTITSVDEVLNLTQTVTIYPNPVKSNFTIQVNEEVIEAHIEIYNLYGEKIFHQKLLNKNIFIKQAPGIYFVRIVSGLHAHTQKLIVE